MEVKNKYFLVVMMSSILFSAEGQWVNGANNYTTGSVGIGLTTTPMGRLHLRDGAFWSSFNYGAALVIDGPHNNAIAILDAGNSNPIALANVSGNFTIAAMPPLG